MKRLLFIIFFLIPVLSFSQQEEYTYHIKILDVKNIAEAKMASEHMYHIFDAMPKFNGTTKSFVVRSTVNVPEAKFKTKLKVHGYFVADFIKSSEPILRE